jgi:hypothetical protein
MVKDSLKRAPQSAAGRPISIYRAIELLSDLCLIREILSKKYLLMLCGLSQ